MPCLECHPAASAVPNIRPDAQGPLPRRFAALDTVQGCRQYVALVRHRRQRRQRSRWLCHALAALAVTLAVCEGTSGASWALLLAIPAPALGWCAGQLLRPRRVLTRAEYLGIPGVLDEHGHESCIHCGSRSLWRTAKPGHSRLLRTCGSCNAQLWTQEDAS